MWKKIGYRIYLAFVLAVSLAGCSAIRGVGDALGNSFKGFSIQLPTIHFP